MKPFRAAVVVSLLAKGAEALTPQPGEKALPLLSQELADGAFLDNAVSMRGPDHDDGTPSKLYSFSLGRKWHNHTANAEVSAAVEAKKLARRDWQQRRSLYLSFEDTPLFPGWGTHFAYVYAGTPPQRVSVIVDTGSHFTAFPCSECKNCGSHTDPHWDHTKSSSSRVVSCKDCHGSFRCQKSKRCGFSQRYSEGSSWSAYQVEDVLWVGELTLQESEKLGHDESAYSVEFMFGCIESQTGLFKTQLADGIMGMSADSHTLVWQLAAAGKIKERTFSLCFGLNGGTMVIGGYDPRLNNPGVDVEYTPSTKSSGWFTVKVDDITLNGVSIESNPSVYQRGKGIIVDSGTTDTYLPKSVAVGFSKAWEKSTGTPYKTCSDNRFCITLTPAELEDLPTLTVHMDGGLQVHVRPQAYMDALGKDNAYAPRIYLTESMGGVLGANVMRDHNVVFDYDNHRVGFAEGTCDYKADILNAAPSGVEDAEAGGPHVSVEHGVAAAESENVNCITAKEMVRKCDAKCPVGLETALTINGQETWVDVVVVQHKGEGKVCPGVLEEEQRDCLVDCPAGAPNPSAAAGKGGGSEHKDGEDGGAEAEPVAVGAMEQTYCSIEEELWTPCSVDCMQERYMGEECDKDAEVRPCHVGDSCSTSKAGLLLAMDLTLRLDVGPDGVEQDDAGLWVRWIGTAVADAVASQLKDVRAGNVEATLSLAVEKDAVGPGASVPCTARVEMHLTPKVDNASANRVSETVNTASFPGNLHSALAAAKHRHWLLPAVTVASVSFEKLSVFIASNGEAYLPPKGDRLQSAKPRASRGESPHGAGGLFGAGAMVVAAIAVLVLRVKHLRPEEESGRPASEVEMLTKSSHSTFSGNEFEGEGSGPPLRRGVRLARGA